MSIDNEFYCKIEIFCFSNIILPEFVKGICFKIKDDDYYNFREEYSVYTKDFYEYQSVIDCLNIVNKQFNDIKYQNMDKKQCESVLLYNKWRKSPLDLSMYGDKWMLLHRSILTNEWKENLDRFGREQETVITRIPYYEEYEWCEFISKERVYLLVKDFLEKGNSYKQIGDFDEDNYNKYLHDFWQSWIEDDESQQSEQAIEFDNELKNETLNGSLTIEILDDSQQKIKDGTLSKEVDGQLNLFDFGLDI
jgi:hypothetical protein